MSNAGPHGLVTAPVYMALVSLIFAPYIVTIPVYVQMCGLSCMAIYLGSHRALEKEVKRKDGDGDGEPREVLSGLAVYRFPFVASVMLGGLFLAFKYLPKEWVSFCLTAFSTTLGAITAIQMFTAFMSEMKLVPKKMTEHKKIIPGYLEISGADLISAVFTIPFVVWYWKKKHWLPNNVLSASLALSAIEAIALEDYKSGAILLGGLFFYDIFWVFGSTRVFGDNVMVAVAKQFEGPIKLVFPKYAGAPAKDTSMLGLGDIVIPGYFVAMLLRYDEFRLHDGRPGSHRPIYFYTNLLFYFIGLVCTYLALTIFSVAQPALLYLVPACLLSSLGLAAYYKEVRALISYSEKEEEEEEERKKGDVTDNKQPQPDDSVTAVAANETKKTS
mmetsp:Transcript_12855/g.39546  ORF Transcript_12855/g.39546 Transcript_12855/m.39546 type:complete len:387 (+) Transcript_12855:107-1267(+)|eukprot:CAMPEP_0198728574 /NCGR_PEP_ID=MMETSP1475-20131203/10012_1 /TAXON_ID= ORGANISM="Unidentified sp., Strain CCMP1999" /NCGR_SAMPLE_ID=MMETSP1475 /ASSEMBLY_ACC=CAM_ASM_001111 /LENGTH=386 /DNA_ID=CAMNT_0044490973 /DNA_START=84 /DNA_END=1244 /DNA_ORIENTATION=+